MADSKAPVLFLELVDRKNSGFVLNGTENTVNHTELNAPTILWIPNSGYMCKKVKETINGREVETTHNTQIRWIKNENSILVEEQQKRNIQPNRYEDKIPVDKGYATVVRDGATTGLYDYLTSVYYNGDAEGRPETADMIFRAVKLDEKAEGFAEDDDILADAIKLVTALRVKTKTGFKYNEDKINAYCNCLNVFGETSPIKIHALMTVAKSMPGRFVETIRKFDQQTSIEIAHAIELKVIMISGSSVNYVDGAKVLTTLPAELKTNDQKIKALADYLQTPEAAGALTELRSKVELAKEKLLK